MPSTGSPASASSHSVPAANTASYRGAGNTCRRVAMRRSSCSRTRCLSADNASFLRLRSAAVNLLRVSCSSACWPLLGTGRANTNLSPGSADTIGGVRYTCRSRAPVFAPNSWTAALTAPLTVSGNSASSRSRPIPTRDRAVRRSAQNLRTVRLVASFFRH